MAFNYSPKVVTDGLVLYLDAANQYSYVSGSTSWNDISRSGNNGTLVNGPIYNNANGGSIVFDGTDDIVNVSSIILVGDFSITQTINLISTSNGPMPIGGGYFASGSDYRGYIWFRTAAANEIRFKVNGETGPDFSVLSSKWVNKIITYTVTRNGSTSKIYINGVEEGSSSISTNNFTIRTIGASYNYPAYSCNGKIYTTSIYNRALSATEVLQNYNATKTRFGL
jgi:hypothetical protein